MPSRTLISVRRALMRHFRRSRMRRFERMFGLTNDHRIIDVGGTAFNWRLVSVQPWLVFVNPEEVPRENGKVRAESGDGRCLAYPDNAFDIAYSNSVIEHVGAWEAQQAFAREITRIAPAYFVQTPYRWFPVEPHVIALFIHYLPPPVYRRLVRWCSLWGLLERPAPARVATMTNNIRLLGRREMRALFPDATILTERFMGLPKALIAVRVPPNMETVR